MVERPRRGASIHWLNWIDMHPTVIPCTAIHFTASYCTALPCTAPRQCPLSTIQLSRIRFQWSWIFDGNSTAAQSTCSFIDFFQTRRGSSISRDAPSANSTPCQPQLYTAMIPKVFQILAKTICQGFSFISLPLLHSLVVWKFFQGGCVNFH